MKAFGRPLLLALTMAVAALVPLPAEAATEHPVRTTPAGEFQPARGPSHLAWEQNTKGQPNHYDVFVQPDGGEAVRVNAGRSNAAMGGMDDDLLVYQQYRKNQSNLFFYDLNTGQRSGLHKKVNSKLWEYWPSIAEPWLLFGRWKMSNDARLLILHNVETGQQRVLNRIRGSGAFIGPGQVNGDYAVWSRCPSKGRCQVYRYQISTAARIKMPNPGSFQRAPSVNAEGTVFFSRGSKGCGGAVKIVKIAPDGTESILTQFPEGLDSRDTYAYTDEGGITHVHYERFGCGKKTGSDIYQVMDPELTGSITVIKEALPPDPQPFEFDPSPNLQAANFFLDDDGIGSNHQTFTGLAAGTYTLQEVIIPSSWQIVELECVGDMDGDTTTGMSLATINLDPGEHIVCTYTNAKEGSITIEKDALPNDAQDFEFDPSSNLQTTTFLLDDDPASSRTNQETFEELDVPDSYTVKEVNIPPGWRLTGMECVGGGLNTTVSIATATATIGLDAGEAVVCTFANTEEGSITIIKDAVNNSTQDFGYSTTGGLSPAAFSLDDDSDPTLSNQRVFTDLLPGTYTVTENADPTGWQLTDITCVGGGGNTSDAVRTATIGLDPGEDVVCTFTNTEEGTITIVKDAVNNSTQVFGYSTTGGLSPAAFSLDDDSDPTLSNQQTFTDLLPGSYTVTENADPPGWLLTDITCVGGGGNTSDAVRTATIGLDPGEDVSCTFENTEQGTIIVAKETNPDGSTQSFEFDIDYGPNFFLTDGGTNSSGDLAPGTYSVSELTPSGWTLTAAACSDGSAPGAISLGPGETVTCTFTNTEQGSITIALDAVPDDPQDFDFSAVGGLSPSAFTLDDDDDLPGPSGISDTRVYSGVLPGMYTVTETIPSPLWNLGSIVCIDPDDGSSGNTGTETATIDLDPGETVTCTFTNSL